MSIASHETTPCRNRSASLDDAGLPAHERKRPRLSEPQTAAEGTLPQAEAIISITSSPSSTANGGYHIATPASSFTELATADIAMAGSPTSKVTINTRPLSSQSVVHSQPRSDSDTVVAERPPSDEKAVMPSASHIDSQHDRFTKKAAYDDPETISISSSEGKSPEIEVAEVDDFDQDSSNARWTTLKGNASDTRSIQAGYVRHTFPYNTEGRRGNAHNILEEMGRRVLEAHGTDAQYLQEMRLWLQGFLTRCDVFREDILSDETDFWSDIHDFLFSLLKRQKDLPTQLRKEDLLELFAAYTDLTALFMDFDLRRLCRYTVDTDPKQLKHLLSAQCIGTISLVLSGSGAFFSSLRRSKLCEPAVLIDMVTARCIDRTGRSVGKLLPRLITALGELLPRRHALYQSLAPVVQLMVAILTRVTGKPPAEPRRSESNELHSASTEVDDIIKDIFCAFDSLLDTATIKQHSWLTLDVAKELLETSSPSFHMVLARNAALLQTSVHATGVDVSDIPSEALASIADYPWRFKVLHKFITHGRMELRVYGVERVGKDLIEIYSHHIQNIPDFSSTPVVLYGIKFIRSTKLIDYVIGVDSHSQLLQRSAPIIGFLGVTKTYTDRDTDVIWKAILDSQDSRRAHEIFKILSESFPTFEIQRLKYICDNLQKLPFELFDQQMLRFALSLAAQTDSKDAGVEERREAAMSLRKLCVQLMLVASAPEDCHKDHSNRVRESISFLLQKYVLPPKDISCSDWDDAQENELISALTQNITAHNNFATGSVVVITILLSQLIPAGVARLDATWKFAELLTLDLVHLNNSTAADAGSLSQFACDQRVAALSYVWTKLPESMTDELVNMLWGSLLVAKHLPLESCSRAWSTMTNILSHDGYPNSFLQKVVESYLPVLQPSDCTQAILEFIKAFINTEATKTNLDTVGEAQVVGFPGIERIWHIMLEAADEHVQLSATNFIMKMYLDDKKITRSPASAIEATHLALVDRGVRQVMEEARQLCLTRPASSSTTMVKGETSPDSRRFYRSLIFLRKFLEGMKDRPKYNYVQNNKLSALPKFGPAKGEQLKLKVQLFGSKYIINEVQEVIIGSENTCGEFSQYLAQAAGLPQIRFYHLGSEYCLEHDDQRTVAAARLDAGLLMVKRQTGSPDTIPRRATRADSPVDSRIMHHFDDLYQLLDAREDLAREVYNFLLLLPNQQDLALKIRSMSLRHSDLLPPARPYKLMYSARALKGCVEEQSFSSEPNVDFLLYSVHTICDALKEIGSIYAASTLHTAIACDLLEIFVLALRAKVDAATSRSFITNPEALVRYLSSLIRTLLLHKESDLHEINAVPLKTCIRTVFDALVEATLHDSRLWEHLNASNGFAQTLQLLLLEEQRLEHRQTILDAVQSVTGPPATKTFLKVSDTRYPRVRFSPATIDEFLTQLWTHLTTLTSSASSFASQCHEYFETLLLVVKRISKVSECQIINGQPSDSSQLLLDHKYVQNVGHPLSDFFVLGMSRLLCQCFQLACKDTESLKLPDYFVEKIWSKFLFPPLTNPDSMEPIPELPVLDSSTRESLYEMILALCTSNTAVLDVIAELETGVVPTDYFDTQYGNERLSLRSSVGYAGLRNLSNTCYLNSLFSQLFMNTSFREFVIRANIVSSSTQALLGELAKVFSHMQNSCEKCVDPSGAVSAITTYDGDGIDVSVQMDVDEFFNLLFDRLEGEVLDDESKARFKGMYGGKLVQQIKSKECEHISEREEPFSAVQVEIRGKADLQESLRAYVEGEVLQGDNKYSCTACGRHVDAVKRACLKDIPDNLIFNLKRFDYDIMTGSRQKVNDEFSFPFEIDMTPYKLEQLMDSEQHVEPDVFELVGIIVHSGTADSGHYYSFIRQRPSSKDQNLSWVQFNDHDVSPFDPAFIAESCYGGIDESSQQFRLSRFYSAYMLFYQRKSSIQKFEVMYQQRDSLNPVHVPLRSEMEQHLMQSNELYLRTYCAQDPSHARFMRQILERPSVINHDQCSPDHIYESRLMAVVLEYVQQISGRWKERPEFEPTISELTRRCTRCVLCAQTTLSWLCEENRIRDVLLRSSFPNVRGLFATLLLSLFTALAKEQREIEEADVVNEPSTLRAEHIQRLLENACYCLRQHSDLLQKFGRAWHDYFLLLAGIVDIDLDTAILVLDAGFLELAIELVEIHTLTKVPRNLRYKYNIYMSWREKNRFYGHGYLITFLANVLQHMDLELRPTTGGRARSGNTVGPSSDECELLGVDTPPYNLQWMFKVIYGRTNPAAALRIVATLSKSRKLIGGVKHQLDEGLGQNLLDDAASFIPPTIMFLQQCPNQTLIVDLIESTLEGVASIGVDWGKEYLLLIAAIVNLRNDEANIEPGTLIPFLLGKVGHWAPPLLLYPSEVQHNVSTETVEMLRGILLVPLDQAQDTDPAQYRVYRQYVCDLAEGCIRYVSNNYLNATKKDSPTLTAGQAHQMAAVISHCTAYFNVENAAEEEQLRVARETVANLNRIAERVQREDSVLSSHEWEEGDEVEALSEDYTNGDTP